MRQTEATQHFREQFENPMTVTLSCFLRMITKRKNDPEGTEIWITSTHVRRSWSVILVSLLRRQNLSPINETHLSLGNSPLRRRMSSSFAASSTSACCSFFLSNAFARRLVFFIQRASGALSTLRGWPFLRRWRETYCTVHIWSRCWDTAFRE